MEWRRMIGIVVLSICLFCVQPCDAIYEDQVGLWDWYQQYVGHVKLATFHTYGTKKRVFVATESNVIAALNLRTGDIVWRKVLAPGDGIDKLEAHGKYILSLSRGGTTLRAWGLLDGSLAWEAPAIASTSGTAASFDLLPLPVDLDRDGIKDIAVLSSGAVLAFSSADGTLLWRSDLALAEGSPAYHRLYAPDSSDKILAVGLDAGGRSIHVASIELKSGASTSVSSNPASTKLSGSVITIAGSEGLGAILSSAGNVLHIFDIAASTSTIPLVSYPLKELLGQDVKAMLLSRDLEGAVALSVSGKGRPDAEAVTVLVKIGKEGGQLGATVGERFEGPAAVTPGLVFEGKHAVGVVIASAEGAGGRLHLRVEGSMGAGEETDIEWAGHGGVRAVFLNAYARKDGGYGFRALVVGEDDSVGLLQQGEVVWVREEGLASIVGVEMVDLPPDKEGHKIAEVERNLVEWLKDHWVKAKVALMLATDDEKAAVATERKNNKEKTALTADHNGFRKLIVALTRSGKVYALHSGDGRIVWSTFASPFRWRPSGERPVVLKLLLWRVPHRRALDESPEVLVLAKTGHKSNAPGILTCLNAHSGEELSTVTLAYPVKQAIPLPLFDSSERRLLLLVDDAKRAHVLPATSEAAEIFASHAKETFFYEVDPAGKGLSGYAVVGSQEAGPGKGEGEGAKFRTELTWTIMFPEEKEVVATVAKGRQDEPVHALAKVLGNRDVLYKYLNRNTIFVATVAPLKDGSVPAGVGVGEPASPEESALTVYIIDAVSGQILYRVSHQGMQGPVHAVLSENWIVYHYFNSRMHRFEVSVLELYEDSHQSDRNVFNILRESITGGKKNGSEGALSSFAVPQLKVLGQSYFFSRSVRALAVTTTAKGITGKHILFGTVSDQVLAMEKRFLDPRRPVTPSVTDREEGLIPYSDTLPIITPSYLTQNRVVEGLRGIVTAPARLESSCLVLAYGLDLFYTRTAPSRNFDTLEEDFSFALLLGTFVILAIAIGVTWVLGMRKELSLRWK
eukprot:TRINITY_DN8832_c0_g2_i1.p1 TRINITY_DN8832_c0_g2~~TRINITY_DN8832_c0_g2_i1.p1  ORF type:complete len:1022 (-),score=187.79 TRINITY_DN8832_c0_g2_i1:311-3376(-)